MQASNGRSIEGRKTSGIGLLDFARDPEAEKWLARLARTSGDRGSVGATASQASHGNTLESDGAAKTAHERLVIQTGLQPAPKPVAPTQKNRRQQTGRPGGGIRLAVHGLYDGISSASYPLACTANLDNRVGEVHLLQDDGLFLHAKGLSRGGVLRGDVGGEIGACAARKKGRSRRRQSIIHVVSREVACPVGRA